MLLSLFLVTQASILSLSFRECELSERTRQIIQDEASVRAEAQGQNGPRSDSDGRSFAIAENDRIILGRIIDGSLVEIGIEPIRFLEDGQEATGL